MTDQHALLAAIIADRADDTPRLVYADWLDENGQNERAEFIRVQVEIEPLRGTVCICDNGRNSDCEWDKFSKLWKREQKLLRGWRELVGPVARKLIPNGAQFDRHLGLTRGFVSHITCTAASWLAHAFALYWHPSQTVGQYTFDESVDPTTWEFDRVPRPCPPTAQPIERVTLTTPAEADGLTDLYSDPADERGLWRSKTFPGVLFGMKFSNIRIGGIAVPLNEWSLQRRVEPT